MITWPESFPKPTVDFGIDVNTSAVRTKMDSGRVRQHRRFTRDHRQMPVKWNLKDYEYGLFQSIYRHTLNSGTDWFRMSLPLGDDLKVYTVRFVANSYKAVYDDVMYWNVSAKLETEDESSPYDKETIDALVAVGLDIAIFELAGNEYHEAINTTLPSMN